MAKIIITGSAGLVGSACVDLFKEKGWEVIGVDNNMRNYFFGTEPQPLDRNIDIRQYDKVYTLFAQEKPDAIIHAAAQPSHDWAKNDPLLDFDVNARATLILLEATRKFAPNATFVHVSTDKVYGENMGEGFLRNGEGGGNFTKVKREIIELETRFNCVFPYTELLGLDFAGKRSLFGCSKTAADIYVQEYGNYFGMKTACFRCGCITGKKHQGAEYHGFLAYLVKCIKEGKEYKIFGHKGKQVRDQIHASDLANAFYHFIQNPRVAEVYNMGGGPERSVSILEAIDLIEKQLYKNKLTKDEKGFVSTKGTITYERAVISHHEPRQGDRIWDVHDVSKFRSHYPNWDYKYSLNDIIKDLCQ